MEVTISENEQTPFNGIRFSNKEENKKNSAHPKNADATTEEKMPDIIGHEHIIEEAVDGAGDLAYD